MNKSKKYILKKKSYNHKSKNIYKKKMIKNKIGSGMNISNKLRNIDKPYNIKRTTKYKKKTFKNKGGSGRNISTKPYEGANDDYYYNIIEPNRDLDTEKLIEEMNRLLKNDSKNSNITSITYKPNTPITNKIIPSNTNKIIHPNTYKTNNNIENVPESHIEVSGSLNIENVPESHIEVPDSFNIILNIENEHETPIDVSYTDNIINQIQESLNQLNIDYGSIEVSFAGNIIEEDDTFEELGIEKGARLSVKITNITEIEITEIEINFNNWIEEFNPNFPDNTVPNIYDMFSKNLLEQLVNGNTLSVEMERNGGYMAPITYSYTIDNIIFRNNTESWHMSINNSSIYAPLNFSYIVKDSYYSSVNGERHGWLADSSILYIKEGSNVLWNREQHRVNGGFTRELL